MKGGSWYSERFPAGGALAATGMLNQLGRPNLSLIEVLAREAIQNSWDARFGRATVDFRVDGWSCPSEQQLEIEKLLRTGLPSEGLALGNALKSEALKLLVVSDRGTTGLGGPTRADVEYLADEPRDFVGFIRNVGEPRDKKLGAGTFGFGKSIFYLFSKARTVVAYTRCRTAGGFESRFIGYAIGDEYRVREGNMFRPYTGRHWWGVPRDGVQEPLLGPDADEAASVFGLPRFNELETGTAVVIIDPTIEDPTADMSAIAWAITWHAWPKVVATEPTMTFKVSWDGEEVLVPDPVKTPPLDAFVSAYRRRESGEGVDCANPSARLGRLSLERQLVRVHRPTYPASFTPPITSPVHHVALIRAPEFVVKYFAGDPLPGDVAEYSGVFMADAEVDGTFARAEPPTHDDWIAAQLTGHDKRFVRTLFSHLKDRLRVFARPVVSDVVSTHGIPLGAASAEFAGLVASAHASGATTTPSMPVGRGRGQGGPGHRGGPGPGDTKVAQRQSPAGSIEELGEPYYGIFEDDRVLLFPFRVLRAAPGAYAVARLGIGIDENQQTEQESPEGSSQPGLVGWLGPDGATVRGDELQTQGRIGQIWHAAVAPVPDTVTMLRLKVEKSSS
jgi:hypothetical protein